MGIGSAEDLVSSEFRANQLTDNVTVGEADNQAVLGRVVLVLGLGDEALAGVVVWVVGQSGVACCLLQCCASLPVFPERLRLYLV